MTHYKNKLVHGQNKTIHAKVSFYSLQFSLKSNKQCFSRSVNYNKWRNVALYDGAKRKQTKLRKRCTAGPLWKLNSLLFWNRLHDLCNLLQDSCYSWSRRSTMAELDSSKCLLISRSPSCEAVQKGQLSQATWRKYHFDTVWILTPVTVATQHSNCIIWIWSKASQ